jgi:farnesyl-diphosphate farnesyltransferase
VSVVFLLQKCQIIETLLKNHYASIMTMTLKSVRNSHFAAQSPLDRIREAPNSLFPDDDALQAYLLEGVSRTFALTIPQLPERLRKVVSNAYLLCRIVDTIEDEPTLSAAQKRFFSDLFIKVVAGKRSAHIFSSELSPLLSASTLPVEHELIQYTPAVIGITLSFNPRQREALEHCIEVMAEGMVEFQENQGIHGLSDLPQLDRYCYHVAGIVGETLTKLFCDYSSEIEIHEERMLPLAVSFGQGLQMTNILKDMWDDRKRGACWLPRDIFASAGFNLDNLVPYHYQDSFGVGLTELIGIATGHLRNAVSYTLIIPAHEAGIRNFCLWAIGMAVLTLRKIHKHLDFNTGNQVKISRRSVKATMLVSRLFAAHDFIVKSLFGITSISLPGIHRDTASRS